MIKTNLGGYIYIGLRSDGRCCLLEMSGKKYIDCCGTEHTGAVIGRIGQKEVANKLKSNGRKTFAVEEKKLCA